MPSIMAHRRYIHRSLCNQMSFECAARLGKSYVNVTTLVYLKAVATVQGSGYSF